MREMIFGEEIRRLRVEKGITQERLADGICSASSLSRIENGSQVPSRRTFRLLMERLDGPDYSYAHFLSPAAYKREMLQEKILEALEYHNREFAAELLGEFAELNDFDNVKSYQFFEMCKLICFGNETQREEYAELCFRILKRGRPHMEGEALFLDKLWEIRIMKESLHMVKNDWVEFLILNNLAVGYMWRQDYAKAIQIFAFMFSQLEDDAFMRRRSFKTRGVLCHNIALCLLQMGKTQEAKTYLRKSFICMQNEGGILPALHLLRTKMELSKMTNELDGYNREEMLLKSLQWLLPMVFVKQENISDILWERKELLIL